MKIDENFCKFKFLHKTREKSNFLLKNNYKFAHMFFCNLFKHVNKDDNLTKVL